MCWARIQELSQQSDHRKLGNRKRENARTEGGDCVLDSVLLFLRGESAEMPSAA